MNTVVAKVIAFELGLLIAILTWMAFTRAPLERVRPVEAGDELADESFAAVSPVYPTKPAAVPAVDYLADDQSRGAIASEPVQAVPAYQPQFMTEPYADRGYYDYALPSDPSTYIGTYPEPVLGPEYYGWPYGAYYPYLPATQVVVVGNTPSCRRTGSRFARSPARPQMRPAPRQVRRQPRMQPPPRQVVHRVAPRPSQTRRPGGVVRPRVANTRFAQPARGIRTAWNR